MKLVMKADDGKEIVYFNENMYKILKLDDSPGSYVVEIHVLTKETIDYFNNLFSEKEKNWNIFEKNNNIILETPNLYFIFDHNIFDIVDNFCKEENQIFEEMFLAYPADKDFVYWNYVKIGQVKL